MKEVRQRASLVITVATLCIIATTWSACGGDKKATGARPGESSGDTAINTAAEVAAPVVSHFQAPLEYDFTPILAIVERVVPKTFGSLDSVRQVGDDTHRHYAFEATRDTFTTFVRGSLVHMRTTITYAARGYFKPRIGPTLSAGCGNDQQRPQILIELVTPLTLNRNWHLRSAAKLDLLAPASDGPKDRCIVSILKYDVTGRVLDAARQAITSHLSDIDSKIAQIDLTQRAAGWWALLNRPIRLADGVWLLLQPRQFRLGSVGGERHTLLVQAGLDAYPKIVTGPEPKNAAPPLPVLAKDTSATGFRIALDGVVDFGTASRAVNEALVGKTVTQAKQTVTVQSVVASPESKGRIALLVTFTGDANGTLRFVGTPHLDAGHDHILVPDLDYDLSTNNDLINAFSRLRSDAFRELFRERARVPIGPVLDRGKSLLENGLNRTIGDVMTLSAKVDSVTVLGLSVAPAGLTVRAGAWGSARVSVRQKR
jgi:Domain of unknown function (DUF4403)